MRSGGLNVKTVRRWRDRPYAPRAAVARSSKLDPFKGRIVAWLDAHPLTAQQVFRRLCEAGYDGGISIVKEYVHTIRPRPRAAFLTLAFAPGEVAQVDWGEWGSIGVGNTRRRLSFFVMVLAYSRQLYVEFTLSQTMEHFLAAHIHAFEALGVPQRVMVDNLRSAVLAHVRGEPPQLNPRYLDFARHYGFEVVACNVAKGNEKGRVERAVGLCQRQFSQRPGAARFRRAQSGGAPVAGDGGQCPPAPRDPAPAGGAVGGGARAPAAAQSAPLRCRPDPGGAR
jgi:transposase